MKNINRVAFFNILSILLLQGISFFSSPVFSRLLGTYGFGTLSSFNVWAAISCTVLGLQTNMTIPNARVEYTEEEQQGYQSAVLTLSLLVYAGAAVVIALLMGPISKALAMERVLVLVLLLQSFGSFAVNFLNSKFTYEFKADKNMRLSVGIAISSITIALLFVLNMPMEQRYFGRILGNALVYGVVGVAICFRILRSGKCYFHPDYWKFCVMLSIPLVFQSLSYQILGNSDIMMLKQMAGADESGIYSLAFTLSGIMFTIFTALNSTWIPFFFDDMKIGDRENVVRQAGNFLELFTVLSAGFVLLVREVYHIYADADYWPGMNLIPIMTASYYVNCLCTFPVNYETFRKKTGMVAAATISSALINLGLNIVFILRFGMYGAAIATLLSHSIQFAIHEIYSRLILGKQDYPFRLSGWLKYAAVFAVAVAMYYTLPNLWYIRWAAGAALGLWELNQMRKRKGLL